MLLWASFRQKARFRGVSPGKASKSQAGFGPQDAVMNELSSISGESCERTKAGNEKPEVASPAACNSYLRPQPRREWQGTVGVCHSPEHFCRGSFGGGAPLGAALRAACARNSECPIGFRKVISQGVSNLACPHRAGNPIGWLPTTRPQVLPPTGQRQDGSSSPSTESCFSCVKSFSYWKTAL